MITKIPSCPKCGSWLWFDDEPFHYVDLAIVDYLECYKCKYTFKATFQLVKLEEHID